MQVKKQQLGIGHRTTDWFKIGKGVGVVKAEYCHTDSLTHTQSTLCENLEWMKHRPKIAGRNIKNLRNVGDTIIVAESEDELKSFSMKVKEESVKVA